MRLLVTGAAGFIGSTYVRIAGEEHEIVVLDKLTYAGRRENLQDVGHAFVHGAIEDAAAVARAIDGVDAVVNFAAETHVDRSISEPDAFVKTHAIGTFVLLEAARERGLRYLQVSTDEVYGSIEEGSFTETDKLTPRSPYSAAKAGSDLIALSYVTTHDLPVVVTRCSNNFGPYQHPEKVIPLFTTNLLDGKKVPLYGDGGNVRDWIHVWDHNRAADLVLRKGTVGEIYNIGAGNELTNVELTERLLRLCGRDESFIERVTDRLGHDRRYSITAAKIEQLGWKCEHDLEQGLADTVAWYRDNRWWWEPLKTRAAL